MDHAGPDAPTVLSTRTTTCSRPASSNWEQRSVRARRTRRRLYGRGSADDKAGVLAHAHAVSAWLGGRLAAVQRARARSKAKRRSARRPASRSSQRTSRARADVFVLADAGNWKVGVPGLTYSLRGLAAADIEVRALDGPVHSGMAGGAMPDPVMALARVLASLVDEHGDVAVDGVWDDVRAPAERTRADHGLDDDPPRSRARWACGPASSSRATRRPPLHERLWFRPTLTVIGIDGHPIKGRRTRSSRGRRARVSCGSLRARNPAGARAARRARRGAGAVGSRADVHAARRGRARVGDRALRARRSTRRRARCARASASTRCSWASAARSRSSVRSPTRSAASRRCCSVRAIRAAASTARTRACTSTTGASSSAARCACSRSSLSGCVPSRSRARPRRSRRRRGRSRSPA